MSVPFNIERLVRMLGEARQAVAFTGAGISTESGIPDFRSPGGIWTRYKPIYFDDFMASEEMRRESWRRKFATDETMGKAEPNAGHRALAKLVEQGKINPDETTVAYITGNGPTPLDRELIAQTIAKARADWYGADDGIFDFLQDALTMDLVGEGRVAHSKARVRRFALKVQHTLDALEKTFKPSATQVTIGEVAVGCALGWLDFRMPQLPWRDGRPGLAAWYAGAQ